MSRSTLAVSAAYRFTVACAATSPANSCRSAPALMLADCRSHSTWGAGEETQA